MINNFKQWSINFLAKEDSTYHIISFIISSILFSSFPIIWFLIFMKEKMIFSYDFFTNGMFGLSIFFFFSLILLLIIGFVLVGFITFTIIYLYKKKEDKKHSSLYIAIYIFFVNLIMIVLTYSKINLDIQYDMYNYIILFSFFMFTYLGFWYAGPGLHKFIALIAFILIFILSTYKFHHIVSAFVETGLHTFRMGGDIKTRIIDSSKNKLIMEGNLILLTPNKVFLNEDNITKIFNRNNIIIEFLDANKTIEAG